MRVLSSQKVAFSDKTLLFNRVCVKMITQYHYVTVDVDFGFQGYECTLGTKLYSIPFWNCSLFGELTVLAMHKCMPTKHSSQWGRNVIFVTLIVGAVMTWHIGMPNDTQLFLSFPTSDLQVSALISACLNDILSWIEDFHRKLSLTKTEKL